MDGNNERHRMPPGGIQSLDADEVYGVWVKATDTKDSENIHMFWAYSYYTFENWAEWLTLVGALMEAHGMALE